MTTAEQESITLDYKIVGGGMCNACRAVASVRYNIMPMVSVCERCLLKMSAGEEIDEEDMEW